MADDDDDGYVEGDAGSAPADVPGAVPRDDDAGPAERVVARDKPATFESKTVGDSNVVHRSNKTSRSSESRKAFAELVQKNRAEAAAAAPAAEVDPEDEQLAPPQPKPAPAPVAAAPVTPPPAAPVAPPAPSLDPEVRKLREQLKAEREQLAAERGEWEKQKAAPPPTPPQPSIAMSLEDYVDRPATAYRAWLEAMRGEKFVSDDEFKQETNDFVTSLATDVLGVPLPPDQRNSLESRQARKAVRVSKTVAQRREAELAAKTERERAEANTKAETERVEHEWRKAGEAISGQFVPQQGADGKPTQSTAAGAYPWLAAEAEPGKLVVEWIRGELNKDGTQLTWQEASQRVNDFLKDEATRYYEKRRSLLATPAAPAAKPAAPAAPAPAAPAPTPRIAPVAESTTKWSKEKHLEASKAKFRTAFVTPPKS